MAHSISGKRLLLLCTTTGYQADAFVAAAQKVGVSVIFATDRCHVLEDPWRDGALPLRFEDPESSARQIADFARRTQLDALVSLGDRPTPTAARAAEILRLPYHPASAADVCRDKYRSRELLRAAGLNVPAFSRVSLDATKSAIIAAADGVGYPCVLKPLALSASRGVIRANNPTEAEAAFDRIAKLLRTPEVQVLREPTSNFIQFESYVEGQEIAAEGVLQRGEMKILALFDKPDPLSGPFFEETLYITPSRLTAKVQHEICNTLERAIRTLGLFHGPFHAELRLNQQGIWPLEIAARSIGGLCSRALRFNGLPGETNIPLEEVLIRLALGAGVLAIQREPVAAGVMMVPIPQPGIFEEAEGVEEALRTPGVEEIYITAKPKQKLLPLPEGASYLGFIFARAGSPQSVEAALRGAHRKLHFVLSPALV